MRVRVLYFGVLKETLGREYEWMNLAEGARVDDLLQLLQKHFTQLAPLLKSLAVAVNQQYARRASVLSEGDEVALLPPVSGGRL